MSAGTVGDILKNSYPLAQDDLSNFNPIVPNDGTGVKPLFSPTDVFDFPKPYLTKSGRVVYILGEVDKDVVGYEAGARYYDDDQTFYTQEGLSWLGTSDNNLDKALENAPSAEIDPLVWINHKYLSMDLFFTALDSSREISLANKYYVNRMGFVIELTDDSYPPYLLDKESKGYTVFGKATSIENQSSMFDLRYEIKNWKLFCQYRKTSQDSLNSSSKEPDNYVPELFDPTANQQQILMEELFKVLLKARALSKQLDVYFSYTMDTTRAFKG